MAHEIKQYDKQQGVEMAWHGLTEVLPSIDRNNIYLGQWEIVPVPLQKPDGKPVGFNVLGATDAEELVIGQPYNPATYTPLSNQQFLDLVFDCLGGTQHEIVSTGSIHNRQIVFVTVKLRGMETFEAAGRKFAQFLNFTNGHGKRATLNVNTSNVCIVCANTFKANKAIFEHLFAGKDGKSDDFAVAAKHSKNLQIRLPRIAQVIDEMVGVQAEFKLAMDTLAGEKANTETARKFFAGWLGDKSEKLSTRALNTANRMTELFARGAGNRGENWADVFSAVTDYYTHESAGGENRWKQYVSSEFGAGMRAKAEAFSLLTRREARNETVKRGESLLLTAAA